MDSDEKRCHRCQTTKSRGDFYKSATTPDGLQTQCKACQKLNKSSWTATHREHERSRQRADYAKDPVRHTSRKKIWRGANPEKTKEIGKRSRAKACGAPQRAWAQRNPEKRRAILRNYYANNREQMAKSARDRRNGSPALVIHTRISAQIRLVLRDKKGGTKWSELLGFTKDQLAAHLERQFLPGMRWDNIGKWHIDHIVPLAAFSIADVADPELRRAWALTNLRPLWAKDNYSKRDRRTHLL